MCGLIQKSCLRILGLIFATIAIISLWYFGFLFFIFYILGLYFALYLISILFKTTSITSFLIGLGTFLLYVWFGIWYLFLLYLILKLTFEISFLFIFSLLLTPVIHFFLLAIFLLVGIIIGGPLLLIHSDLERRFGQKNTMESKQIEQVFGKN